MDNFNRRNRGASPSGKLPEGGRVADSGGEHHRTSTRRNGMSFGIQSGEEYIEDVELEEFDWSVLNRLSHHLQVKS